MYTILTLAVEDLHVYRAMVGSFINCEFLCTLQAAVALLFPLLCLVCQTDTTWGAGESGTAAQWLPWQHHAVSPGPFQSNQCKLESLVSLTHVAMVSWAILLSQLKDKTKFSQYCYKRIYLFSSRYLKTFPTEINHMYTCIISCEKKNKNKNENWKWRCNRGIKSRWTCSGLHQWWSKCDPRYRETRLQIWNRTTV